MSEEETFYVPDEVGKVLDNRYDNLNLIIERAVDQRPVNVSIENMRSLERPALVKGLIEKVSTEWQPTLEEMQGLTCILVRDKAKAWADYVSRGENEYFQFVENSLPWPEEMMQQKSPITSKQWEEFVETDEDEMLAGDGLYYAINRAAQKMDAVTASQYASFIFKNMSQLSRNYYPQVVSDLEMLATNNLDPLVPESLLAGRDMIQYIHANFSYLNLPSYFDEDIDNSIIEPEIANHPQRVDYRPPGVRTNGQFGGEIGRSVIGPYLDQKELVLRALAQEENMPNKELYLGTMLRLYGLPTTLNTLRKIYFDPNLKSEQKEVGEMMKPFWRDVVGDGQFQPDLIAFYNDYGYKEYPLTPIELKKREEMLNRILPKLGIKNGDKILDVASGLGGLTDILSQKYDAIGVDINPAQVEQAAIDHPNSSFVVGSWYDLLDIKECEGAKAIIIDGRSLPHVESIDNFYKVLDQSVAVGAEVLIYSFPDPNKGIIGERFSKLRGVMQKFGYNDKWLKDHFFDAVGKLGKNLGNRWLPPEDLLRVATEAKGFRVVDVIREPNYDENGNDNLVFITKYEEDDLKRQEMIARAREKLSHRTNTQRSTPNSNKAFNHYLPKISLINRRFRKNSI